ncbi:Response regulator containing a CheY-like receiver domain and an HD-GYP domain [Hyella patelloides LEGE 07179]|uniref:Response regulator containing a CheY-like receiver domain and an HD-GYP domain n=1 Tax=Hyella patelloides LEGE 07179 TaxID=945734 RepID=A0A563VYU0_9CYAN|nr:response regulator [Hyella patelloides]VEP16618.1 Response regulator containing a CheY-like receiver domain and an HD-GYP domain [Hyella patelloides LEGE 07179]
MKRKILVIEDERTTLNSIVEFLLSEGFDALGAENGRDGIELAQKHLPALIICDILMPELDGYDVLTYLQQDTETAGIPFIFLTATTDSSSFRLGMEMGADDYLRKPVTSAELRAAIASRLRKQEATIQNYSITDLPTSDIADSDPEQLREYSNAQSSLFQFLLEGIKPSISRLNQEMSEFRETLTESKQQEHLDNLEKEFARLLSVVNQVSELHKILTPENTKILSQFDFFETKQ